MKLLDIIARSYSEHKMEWKIAAGCALSAVAVVEAFVVAPKAIEALQELKELHEDDEDRKAYAKDVVTKVIPMVALPVLTEAAAMACIVSGTRTGLNEIATLTTAYAMSERERLIYKEKTCDLVGEKKEKEIRDEVAKSKVDSKKSDFIDSRVHDTGYGGSLMYETLSKTWIRSSIQKIDNAANGLNKRMFNGSESYMTVDEWLYEIGIPDDDELPFGTCTGDLCFTSDREITPSYSADIDSDGRPYIIIDYLIAPGPKPNYTGAKY